MADKINHEIVKHIAVISGEGESVRKELNMVSWNNRDAKFDLRSWSADHGRAYKGITLSLQEAQKLYDALDDYFKGGRR